MNRFLLTLFFLILLASGCNNTDKTTSVSGTGTQPLLAPPLGSASCDGLTIASQQVGVPPAQGITLTQGLKVNGSQTDQFSWNDSAGNARSVSLIRNGCLDSRNRHGGYAEQFSYQVAGTPRIVGSTPSGPWWNTVNAGGFGYIVSHLYDPSVTGGADDSPLDGGNFGNYRTVFLGFNHAVHEFTLNYPRWGTHGGQSVLYQVPVTIQWLVMTGHDHPLWTVTYDLSSVPSGAVTADSRAPYGDMQFDGTSITNGDGSPNISGGDAIGKVAWGESFQFTTTGGNVTLGNAWTWNTVNPYAAYSYMDTQTADAEMGLSATQIITKQDAGGYQGGQGRGATSATASCPVGGGGPYAMPCAFAWPFQTINDSLYDQVNTTCSKRLAWGTDWYLGQPAGALLNGQPNVNGNAVVGWPRLSYSTYIVLGQKSTSPTLSAAKQAQTIDKTLITAFSGVTVNTQGAAGAGRSDTITYSPAGFDPIYAVWRLKATNTNPVFTIKVGVGSPQPLVNPVFVINGVTDASAPISVSVGGIAQTANTTTGYYSSYDPVNQQLWITIMKSFAANGALTTVNIGL